MFGGILAAHVARRSTRNVQIQSSRSVLYWDACKSSASLQPKRIPTKKDGHGSIDALRGRRVGTAGLLVAGKYIAQHDALKLVARQRQFVRTSVCTWPTLASRRFLAGGCLTHTRGVAYQ